FDRQTSTVTIPASATVPTQFMGVIAVPSITVNSTATIAWGVSRLRVALVLDNTGSMSSAGKLTALKTATNSLLSQLQSAATQNGDVYVSIVPFVKDVNVDPANYTQSWIDWTDWDANNGTCSVSAPTKNQCGWCSNSNYTSMLTCQAAGKTWHARTWTPK